ncbi:hypothetical protein K440DRAFT_637459 [Wilcoxina mikolae CBS 423.85]|nr:hypothetical protein K440DRAFT_637459 [Wilcoxina mikolae CBS 423.85]
MRTRPQQRRRVSTRQGKTLQGGERSAVPQGTECDPRPRATAKQERRIGWGLLFRRKTLGVPITMLPAALLRAPSANFKYKPNKRVDSFIPDSQQGSEVDTEPELESPSQYLPPNPTLLMANPNPPQPRTMQPTLKMTPTVLRH